MPDELRNGKRVKSWLEIILIALTIVLTLGGLYDLARVDPLGNDLKKAESRIEKTDSEVNDLKNKAAMTQERLEWIVRTLEEMKQDIKDIKARQK